MALGRSTFELLLGALRALLCRHLAYRPTDQLAAQHVLHIAHDPRRCG